MCRIEPQYALLCISTLQFWLLNAASFHPAKWSLCFDYRTLSNFVGILTITYVCTYDPSSQIGAQSKRNGMAFLCIMLSSWNWSKSIPRNFWSCLFLWNNGGQRLLHKIGVSNSDFIYITTLLTISFSSLLSFRVWVCRENVCSMHIMDLRYIWIIVQIRKVFSSWSFSSILQICFV